MHLRQLIYCFVLVGILGMVAKTASPAGAIHGKDLSGRFPLWLAHDLSWIGLGVLVLLVRAALLPI